MSDKRTWRSGAVIAAALALLANLPMNAEADRIPPRTSVVHSDQIGPRWERVEVESAAMGRTVTLDVLHGSGSGPRPTLYLLDGVDAEGVSDWLTKGHAADFFADKPVDVVFPAGATGSMYTDWEHPDAALGWNRWDTFLTSELPGAIEPYLHSDGQRAIAGVSMGAQGAMMLAHRHPGLYRAVAGLSGCYSTVDGTGSAITALTVASRGGNVVKMWGPPGTFDWLTHDSTVGAEALRGTVIYLSAASGVPGAADLTEVLRSPDVVAALQSAGGGVPLEAGARFCTERFAKRLSDLGIPATVHYEPTGIHAWEDFSAQLGPAWDTLATAFGR
ncbi:alpha/beta hydrolase family protein [Nocardia sp. CDC153]|uniref:alpha/beta hydrolase n=1 Tax=Nocardia sp. CDC153 TaxID=3112167 RepID=UPI002DB5FE48|nr:alpha/beta hydrolase family protein [Nocardia sp. CDC153]MEC3954695.1 alpha/beta hydrolase family protein [Nocardia sp. CDC153]